MIEQGSPQGNYEDEDRHVSLDQDEFTEPPEEKHEAEHKNLSERRDILTQIVTAYKNHPANIEALNRASKIPGSLIFYENEKRRYDSLINQFSVIENKEVLRSFFESIEDGFSIWEAGARPETARLEERGIFIKATTAYNIVLFSNLRLVYSIAQKNVYGSLSFLDLFHEGVFGLHDAIAGFDYQRDFTFSTYAIHRIRGCIKRAVANDSRTIRLPVHAHEALQTLKGKLSTLTQTYGRELTYEEKVKEIEKLSGRSKKLAEAYLQSGSFELPSLDAPIGDDSNSETLGDFISQEIHMRSDVDEMAFARAAIARIIRSKKLTVKEKLVLTLKAGLSEPGIPELHHFPPEQALYFHQYLGIAAMLGGLRVRHIAIVMKVTQSRVDQLLKSSYKKAREILESNEAQNIPQQGEPEESEESKEIPYYKLKKGNHKK